MKFLMDASVAIKIVLPEANSDKVSDLFLAHTQQLHTLHVSTSCSLRSLMP